MELLKETVEKVKKGLAKIVRYGDIKDRLPKDLKMSLVAMITHKSRKFRYILDLFFCLKIDGTKIPAIIVILRRLHKNRWMDWIKF